jgi:hypothetical protein
MSISCLILVGTESNMINIFNIATAVAISLITASTAMANAPGTRANTFGNSMPRYVEFCAQIPHFGESYAQPYGPYSLPPSVIMRNPNVSAFAWEEKRSFDRVSGDIFCISA